MTVRIRVHSELELNFDVEWPLFIIFIVNDTFYLCFVHEGSL